jgi:hypothetical protein
MRIKADALNAFYRIPTPENAPLRAGLGDMLRFKTYPICARCDRQFPKQYPLILQIPKFVQGPGGILTRGPGITDERVMEEFMVNACNKAVGCWRECLCGKNWNMKCQKDCVIRGEKDASGFGPARAGDCGCICTCKPGCGNQKKYPCQCGYTSIFHNKSCPVGDFKRDSSFLTAYIRQRLTRRGVSATIDGLRL